LAVIISLCCSLLPAGKRLDHGVVHSSAVSAPDDGAEQHDVAMREADLDRMCPQPPGPDALPRILTRAQATAYGFSRAAIEHRLERQRWRLVLPRTLLTCDTFTESDRWDAALAFAGPGAALSGAAALRASEVRRIPSPAQVLVLVPPGNRTRSKDWVRVRRTFRPIVREQWLGPARVEVCRAAADYALSMSRLDDVRALVARVVQDRHCTLDELATELAAGPRRGSALLRQALAEVGAGAGSAPEAEAAAILRAAGITGFIQNAKLTLPDGTLRIVHFYWPQLRACLEIDSVEWHFDSQDWARTWDRHLELTKFGLSVIHRPPSALRDKRRFVRDIREWLAGRAAELRHKAG
jgi:hypothetical protein